MENNRKEETTQESTDLWQVRLAILSMADLEGEEAIIRRNNNTSEQRERVREKEQKGPDSHLGAANK